MAELHEEDLRLVARFVDGELGADEGRTFEQRLQQESALAHEVEALRARRRLFEQGPITVPGPAFRGRVLDAVAEAGRRQLTEQAPEADLLHRWAPRIVVAAALVLAFCGALATGLFDQGESGDLSASPDELQNRMEEIDQRIDSEDIVDPFAEAKDDDESQDPDESDENRGR